MAFSPTQLSGANFEFDFALLLKFPGETEQELFVYFILLDINSPLLTLVKYVTIFVIYYFYFWSSFS